MVAQRYDQVFIVHCDINVIAPVRKIYLPWPSGRRSSRWDPVRASGTGRGHGHRAGAGLDTTFFGVDAQRRTVATYHKPQPPASGDGPAGTTTVAWRS